MDTLTTCPNCRAFTTKAKQYREYHKCGNCGVLFLSGVSEDELFNYYHSGRYRTTHRQPNETLHQYRRAENIIQYIEKPSVFVDIGSSAGVLLNAVKEKYGTECYGVDIDTVLARNVYRSIKYVPRSPDCVTMIHVLEHMSHPLDELQAVFDKMANGGQIIIEVPNIEYKGAFSFPHVVMFDRYSLSWTMQAAGFVVENVIIHGEGGISKAGKDFYLLAIGRKSIINVT